MFKCSAHRALAIHNLTGEEHAGSGRTIAASTADECANLRVAMMQQAEREGAALLVLPEALLARDDNDPDLSGNRPGMLDGAFCSRSGREQA